MVECAGLENRWAREGPVSSNLTSSVFLGGGQNLTKSDSFSIVISAGNRVRQSATECDTFSVLISMC